MGVVLLLILYANWVLLHYIIARELVWISDKTWTNTDFVIVSICMNIPVISTIVLIIVGIYSLLDKYKNNEKFKAWWDKEAII